MICFVLWREFRLSIAEIHNFFAKSEIVFANKELAFFEWITGDEVIENFHKLWWSIKAIEIINEVRSEKYFISDAISVINQKNTQESGKFCYALAKYGTQMNSFTIWIQIKKELKKSWITNWRLVNKDSNNINAAVYKKEKLNTNWVELNYIDTWSKTFSGITIAYQDVDNYSSRDYGKTRDMNVWMLPPKLAQMMINLTWNPTNTIYDPFCGLGTVLIEAINSGYKTIYWSDINPNMINATNKNLSVYVDKTMSVKIFEQDASRIWKLEFLKWSDISIISEWYLGSVMTKWHMTIEKIKEERTHIIQIYKWFFSDLARINYKWEIVLCFPFWQLMWKYVYFDEIYKLIKDSWFIAKKLLPDWIEFSESKYWSLLYHRPTQQVWREIFCLYKS